MPPRLAHVAANGATVDLEAEFEQLAANALGAPAPIVHGHALNQRDDFRVETRLAGLPLRLVSPEESEPLAMPLEQCLRFEEQQGLFPMREAVGQHAEQATVERREGGVFHLTLQDNELLAQEGVFGDEFRLGSD